MPQNETLIEASERAGQRILSVTEEEMQRIILDLHDGPVQQLFAAQSQLTALQTRVDHGSPPTLDEYQVAVARASRALGRALYEIKYFLGSFRPPDFAHRDLVSILQGLLMHHELTTGCEIAFCGPETPVMVILPVKIALYRICQEALSNATRHGAAHRVIVSLRLVANRVILEIRDNGVGFVPPALRGPEATERHEHVGLRGMRDRIDLIGGKFELHSAPGTGTRIRVEAPTHG